MRLHVVSLLALLFFFSAPVHAQADAGEQTVPQAQAQSGPDPVSFNISTNKTFSPGEQPTIHLYTHNVDALEFRVYRVADAPKFLENLRELHSFGPEASLLGPEHIDEKSWLERFHDWKSELWSEIRAFFRHQFSRDARRSLRQRQTRLNRKSRILSAAEFAQIPILNPTQLVARWREQVPATYLSDNNDLAVPRLGPGLFLLEATDGRFKAYTLLLVTDTALVTRTTSAGITAFVADRVTGVPLAGARVDAGYGGKALASATTDANGLADLALPPHKGEIDNLWVVSVKDKEVALSTPGGYALAYASSRNTVGYAFTERPVYRPTHTVHWKAILRDRSGNALALPRAATVPVAILDATDQAVFQKDLPLAQGNVSGSFDLPRSASLGYYTLRVGPADEPIVTAGFHVEEYRKPEYRVQVSASPTRVLEGATVPVTLDSRYFFGEPVAGGKVKYRIYHAPHFWWGTPDSSDDDTPDAASDDDAGTGYDSDEEAEKTGVLDRDGRLTLQVPTAPARTGHADLDYTIEAGVTDAANREITGRGHFLATFSTFRINVEPESYALHPNDTARLRLTAVDYDNKPVATRVHLQLRFRHYDRGNTTYTDGPATDVATDTSGHATAELPLGNPPTSDVAIVATAAAIQPGTRNPVDATSIFVLGAGEPSWDSGSGTAQIVTDKKTYAPGDIAHISVVSEAAGFHALVLTEGTALLKREVLSTTGTTVSFDLPITAEAQPNLTVSALFLKNNTLFQASKRISVPPAERQLQVTVTPTKDVFQPQQTATYDVLTRDFAGKPVAADLSFGVVDEAIYSLYPDSSGDMVRALYPQRYANAEVESSLEFYFSGEAGNKSPMLARGSGGGMGAGLAQVKPGSEASPKVRKAFPDTAFWAPDVHTDSSGHARVTLTFPDALTTWRATVHAITPDSRAGSASNKVIVRKDVLVRLGTPRFMLKGDEIALPLIVHNYLDTAKTARVALAAAGLEITQSAAPTVTIPSKGEATVLWRLRASAVGTAKVTGSAVTDTASDALEISFPVEPAGVPKDLSASGVLSPTTPEATSTLTFPASTDPAAHTLHLELSPSIAGSLFPALKYLTSYPYGCTEQTLSSFLPNLVVLEALQHLHPDLKGSFSIDQDDLHEKTAAGLERLADYQHDDGGWGWWKEDQSQVYMTALVVSDLAQAAQLSALPQQSQPMLLRGIGFLNVSLRRHPKMRPELRAAVLYALATAPHINNPSLLQASLDQQWSRRTSLEPEALAMTGLSMLALHDSRAAALGDLLRGKAVHHGELVSWPGSYVPLLDLTTTDDSEATAYALRFLARLNPADPLLPPAAQSLMLARNNGGWWDTTEQTSMVLFGLADYLAATHELDGNPTVDVLLNGSSIAHRAFTPADALSGATVSVDIPAAQLSPAANTIKINRSSGTGRVYWSTRARFFSTDKHDVQAGSLSLNLARDFYKLQPISSDGKILYRLVPLAGTAEVGDVLAVHEAINGSPMRYLLLEDPIPAGAEFVTNPDSYPLEKPPVHWYDTWFTRQEFHDDRAAIFASDFSGRQEVFYLVRIVNPGSFTISPAHVAPMYQTGIDATSDARHLDVPAPASQAAPAQSTPPTDTKR